MRLADVLRVEGIRTDLSAKDKDTTLRTLARMLTEGYEGAPDAEQVYRAFSERERLATTGVGSGVAIPHGRIGSIEQLRAAVAICPDGIPFDAIDGAPVRIIFGVLAPQHHTGDHLRVLARVSRLLRSVQVRESLLEAADARAAFDVIAKADVG